MRVQPAFIPPFAHSVVGLNSKVYLDVEKASCNLLQVNQNSKQPWVEKIEYCDMIVDICSLAWESFLSPFPTNHPSIV